MRTSTRVETLRAAAAGIVLVCFLCISSTDDISGRRRRTTVTSDGRKERLGGKEGNHISACPPVTGPHQQHLLQLTDIFSEEMAIRTSGLNVFLLESSCSVTPSYRAWCAVESLARQNPVAQVWYVMTSRVLNLRNGLAARLVERYPNLRPVTANLQQVFSGTPLMDLYTSREWNRNTKWPEINLADLMRLGLVWHLGGFYVDSDVVCIRPLTNLTNAIGWQERSTLGSGVFHFTRNHPVLLEVMKFAAETFQSGVWGSSGPQAFTAVLKHMCGNKIHLLDGAPQCQGVTVLPIRAFYPVPATIWKTIFTPQAYRKITLRYPFSYMIHTWNQKSSSQPVVKDSGSIYDEAARVFCPVTRSLATAHSSAY